MPTDRYSVIMVVNEIKARLNMRGYNVTLKDSMWINLRRDDLFTSG